MAEKLVAVPMFAPGKTVRIAHMAKGGYASKRLKPGIYTVKATGEYAVLYGFKYTLTSASGEEVTARERYLVPSEGWPEWYAVRIAERAERETAKAWAMFDAKKGV